MRRSSQALMSIVFRGLMIAGLCVVGSGCSVGMALKQPDKKDLSVLQPGNSRNAIIAELGMPMSNSKSAEGLNTDFFKFKQGYSDLTRAGRALGHAGLDVSTLALWELAGMPLETYFDGENVHVEVAYDSQDRAQRIEYYDGAYLRDGSATLPREWKREPEKTALLGDPDFGRNVSVQQAGGSSRNGRFFD